MDSSFFVDIVIYPAKLFRKGCRMPGARPQMQSVVGADREKDVRCTQLAEGKLSVFFIASGSSNSIQLEDCSVWFLAFLILLSVQRCFLQGGLDAGGTTPNAD